jgi:hypothetical protein
MKPGSYPTRTITRHSDIYEKLGGDGKFEIPEPFDLSDVNTEALEGKGLIPGGVVKQLNQVFGENVANLLAAKIRAAAPKATELSALPSQETLNTIIAGYDFSGVARRTDSSALSKLERAIYSIARNQLKKLIRAGLLAADGKPQTVQTAKDAEAGKLEEGKMPLQDFESLVDALVNGDKWIGPEATVERADEDGNVSLAVGQEIVMDFGGEVEFFEDDATGETLPATPAALRQYVTELAEAQMKQNTAAVMKLG